MLGLVGRKEGTRQLYKEGRAIQVTFISLLPNRITQIKTKDKDGYNAIQVTTGQKKPFKINKSELGQFNKANVEPGIGLWEFRLENTDETAEKNWQLGHELTVEQFNQIKWVDVVATTKGKGFAGVIKRHHFSSQDATHGNSLSHRAPGSIGQRQSPRRVFKGKKMAGQLGNKRRTMQSLEVIAVHPEHHLLVVKGSIPGAPGGIVQVKPAVRRMNQIMNKVA
jgi:large subunit ribosomal protein L3